MPFASFLPGIARVAKSATDGVYKQIGDKLRNNPESLRCSNTRECIKLVKAGSHVYVNVSIVMSS